MAEVEDRGLETLVVWQKAIKFAALLCKTYLIKFPNEEKFALIDQVRRSAQSIPANIAEGHGRFYYQEGIHYAYIARGSLEETRSHLTYAFEMGYISSDELSSLKKEIEEIRRLINGYVNYLKKTKRGVYEPGSQYLLTPNDKNNLELTQ